MHVYLFKCKCELLKYQQIIIRITTREYYMLKKFRDKTECDHGDLHTNNVMVTNDRKIKLIDFGQAVKGGNDDIARLTRNFSKILKANTHSIGLRKEEEEGMPSERANYDKQFHNKLLQSVEFRDAFKNDIKKRFQKKLQEEFNSLCSGKKLTDDYGIELDIEGSNIAVIITNGNGGELNYSPEVSADDLKLIKGTWSSGFGMKNDKLIWSGVALAQVKNKFLQENSDKIPGIAEEIENYEKGKNALAKREERVVAEIEKMRAEEKNEVKELLAAGNKLVDLVSKMEKKEINNFIQLGDVFYSKNQQQSQQEPQIEELMHRIEERLQRSQQQREEYHLKKIKKQQGSPRINRSGSGGGLSGHK
mgnify:CR=1 FL=1